MTVQRVATFLVGVAVLLIAIFDEEGVNWGAAIIALILMGIVSVDQILDLIERRRPDPSSPDETPSRT